ncbi:hypothetical protein ACIQUG_28475 [Ensifer sp. NPDC090286]|uniref:hypothetical protein n=1 Tax=Ensifer sp. NPDC090286 TaxID=3363991 RepID=UPI00383BB9E2
MAIFLSCSQSRPADSPAKASFHVDVADGRLSVACVIAPVSAAGAGSLEITVFFQCFTSVIDPAPFVQNL